MYVTDPNLGWNAGARSRNVCFDDCQATFKVPVAITGVVVGLTTQDLGQDFREIPHALFFTQVLGAATTYVYELGVQKASCGTYVATDLFAIRRVGTVVTYVKNGTLLYTSATPLTGPVFMDTSLYAAGDEVI